MHAEERALREAIEAFEQACKELVDALRDDPDAIDDRFALAEARLRAAQEALSAARLRNRQARG